MDIASAYPAFAQWTWASADVSKLDFSALADKGELPLASDLYVSLGVAVGLTVAQRIVFGLVFYPLFKMLLGLRSRDRSSEHDEVLESLFLSGARTATPDVNKVKSVGEVTGMSIPDVNAWLRYRLQHERGTVKLQSFSESFWRLVLYTVAFVVNVSLTIDKPWARDARLCWTDLWNQPADSEVQSFYTMVQLPIYLHLLFCEVAERAGGRSSGEMTGHHVLAIVLIVSSYLSNFLRIGCLTMLCHDVTDLLLESSKLLKYIKWRTLSDVLFFSFAIAWFGARVYYFSTVVIYSTMFDSVSEGTIGKDSYLFFNILLSVLFLLNLYWMGKISSAWYRILWAGPAQASAARDANDLSTDDDSDSSYFSEMSEPGLKRHED